MEIDLLFLIRNKILILKYKFVSVELQISFKVIKYMSHQVSSLSPESWHLLEKERGRREEEGSSGSSWLQRSACFSWSSRNIPGSCLKIWCQDQTACFLLDGLWVCRPSHGDSLFPVLVISKLLPHRWSNFENYKLSPNVRDFMDPREKVMGLPPLCELLGQILVSGTVLVS